MTHQTRIGEKKRGSGGFEKKIASSWEGDRTVGTSRVLPMTGSPGLIGSLEESGDAEGGKPQKPRSSSHSFRKGTIEEIPEL